MGFDMGSSRGSGPASNTGYGGGGGGSIAGSWGRSGYNPAAGDTMGIAGSGSGGGNISNYGTGGISALSDTRVSRFTPAQQRHYANSSIGFGMLGSSHKGVASHYKQLDYEARQRAIKMEALGRLANEQKMFSDIQRMNMPPSDKQKAFDSLRSGNLANLDSLGFDTSAMRSTHHAGGLLGDLFGYGRGGDDVQTMDEIADKLTSQGLATVNPETGLLERPQVDSVWDAMTTGVAVPAGMGAYFASKAVPQKVAEAVYSGNIENIGPAIAAGEITQKGLGMAASGMQPQMDTGLDISFGKGNAADIGSWAANKALSSLPSMAIDMAVPGLGTPLGMMGGMMQRAADLKYGGVLAGETAPPESYGSTDAGGDPVLMMAQSQPAPQSQPNIGGLLGGERFGRLFTDRFKTYTPFYWAV